MRPPGIYGPGSLLELAVYNKVLTRKLSIELRGDIIVHPTYVGDVVEAIIALVEEPAPAGTVFNLGGERSILLRDWYVLIAEMLGVSRRRIVVPASIAGPFGIIAEAIFALIGRPRPLLAEMSRGRCFSSAVDDRRFRRCYSAVPVIPLADGLRQHINWGPGTASTGTPLARRRPSGNLFLADVAPRGLLLAPPLTPGAVDHLEGGPCRRQPD